MGIRIGSENVEKRASTGERPRLVTRKVCRERRGRLPPNRGSCEWRQETAFAAGDVTLFYRNGVAVSTDREREREAILALRKPSLDILFSSQI